MGGHSAMPISAQTPAARKNGRKPRLRIAVPRHARDVAAEARGERWELASETDAVVEMILMGQPRSLDEAAGWYANGRKLASSRWSGEMSNFFQAAHAFGSRRATGCRNA